MNASELYRAGRLSEAIAAQIEVVRDRQDNESRLFLFELYYFAGELERARKQLVAIRYEDPMQQLAVEAYQKCLIAQEKRQQLFKGVQPSFPANPPAHLVYRWQTIEAIRHGNLDEASKLMALANESSPVGKINVNGQVVETFRDADDLLASVVEVFLQDRYMWIPLEQIYGLTIKSNPPQTPRDLILAQAVIRLTPDVDIGVFLPVLYPDSENHPDPNIKLGRYTDWVQVTEGIIRGVGLKTFIVGDGDSTMLELRTIEGIVEK
jgi:type VI secretion system protein ImpE